MELVSVILPVYNGERYLKKCIYSILNQDYDNLEIIAIDDGSKDSSLEILNKIKDDRLKVYTQENKGVSLTRERGIELSNGEYIFFMDCDDYIDNDYIKTYMKYKNFDLVIGGYKRVLEGKVILDKHILNKPFSKFENMAPWGRMIRKNILGKNTKFFSYPIGEDIIFNLNLYSKCTNIKTIDYRGYNWFFNRESVSNTKQKKFDENIRNLLNEMMKYDVNDEIHYFIMRYHIWYLLFCGRYVKSDEFMLEYKNLKEWYRDNDFKGDLSIVKIFKFEQDFKNKIIISMFYLISRFKLVKLFSKIYCKGR